jgi:hypothetical protein
MKILKPVYLCTRFNGLLIYSPVFTGELFFGGKATHGGRAYIAHNKNGLSTELRVTKK